MSMQRGVKCFFDIVVDGRTNIGRIIFQVSDGAHYELTSSRNYF